MISSASGCTGASVSWNSGTSVRAASSGVRMCRSVIDSAGENLAMVVLLMKPTDVKTTSNGSRSMRPVSAIKITRMPTDADVMTSRATARSRFAGPRSSRTSTNPIATRMAARQAYRT